MCYFMYLTTIFIYYIIKVQILSLVVFVEGRHLLMSIFSQDDIDLVHCAGDHPPDPPCEQLLSAGRGPPLVELQRGPVHALQPGAVHLNLRQTCRPCLTMHGMNKDLLCYVESFYLGFNLLKALSTFPLLAHLQRSISEDLRR